jgi:preprotein translocase subunit SecE
MTKVVQFLAEVRSELRKVVWPSRNQTIRYTAIVIVFSVITAVILGAADFGLTRLLETFVTR